MRSPSCAEIAAHLGGFCSAAGTIVGEPVVAFGAVTMGATAGALLLLAALAASTPVVPSGMHLISVSVCAQCSPEPHLPLQGKASHNPLLVLQNVSPVQMAMHPPAAREAAAAPMARLVVAAAPASVLGLPVLHPVLRRRSTATMTRAMASTH
jgi:hypothetical protein